MGWLDKLLGLNAQTAWAIAALLGAGAILVLAVVALKALMSKGNGKGNGTTGEVHKALSLDDRVDVLEDKVSQVVAGLGYLKDEVRDHSSRVNNRIDQLISQLNK